MSIKIKPEINLILFYDMLSVRNLPKITAIRIKLDYAVAAPIKIGSEPYIEAKQVTEIRDYDENICIWTTSIMNLYIFERVLGLRFDLIYLLFVTLISFMLFGNKGSLKCEVGE